MKRPSVPLYFKKEKVKGIHLWRAPGAQKFRMISDDLYKLFVQNEISGLTYEKQEVV